MRLTYKDVNGVGEDTINASATVEHTVGEPVLTSVARVVKTTEHATATHAWTPQPTPVATPASTPAPATAVRFVGNGSNIIYIDWDNDIVAVFRWIRNDRALNEVIAKLAASMKATTSTAAQR